MDEELFVINTIDTDFRAEVVAAGLEETGHDPESLLILRGGSSKRHASKDIVKIEEQYYIQEQKDYLQIYTTRPNIYDSLPEGLFHRSISSGKKTKEDVLEEVRRQQREEFFARRFFQPFEMSIDKLLVDAQLYERKFDKKNVNRNLSDIFTLYWPVLKRLNIEQTLFFIYTIPIFKQVITNFELMGQVISMLLNAPVKVTMGKKRSMKQRVNTDSSLGNTRLGLTTVLDHDFEDGFKSIQLEIGPLPPEQMKLFEFGANADQILKELFRMFLPYDCQINVRYVTTKEYADFRISDQSHVTYLGVNTVI